MQLNRHGANRWVILTRRHALKFPRPTSWYVFLFGLLNNIHEARWQGPGRCPVLLAFPGGLLNIMPRCEILTEADFDGFDPSAFCAAHGVTAEAKPDSFGRLNGQVVAVDYGWW